MRQSVLLPEQRQGHARTAQLGVDRRPVGQWSLLAGHHGGRWKQLAFQLGIGQRRGPGEAAGGKATEIITGTAVADAQTAGDLAGG
ncbi:hypothetical protein D9M69_649200 [compost metagenome]